MDHAELKRLFDCEHNFHVTSNLKINIHCDYVFFITTQRHLFSSFGAGGIGVGVTCADDWLTNPYRLDCKNERDI